MHTKGIPLMQAFPYKILILCFFFFNFKGERQKGIVFGGTNFRPKLFVVAPI